MDGPFSHGPSNSCGIKLSLNLTFALNALSTDHSPVFCSISKGDKFNKGKGERMWKFSNSLFSNIDFAKQMRQLIEHIKQQKTLMNMQNVKTASNLFMRK